MENEKKPSVLGAFLDTLVLNVVPTDMSFNPEVRPFSGDLGQKLAEYKEEAQNAEEDVPTIFSFDGACLFMAPKGGTGFMWILRNKKISIAIVRKIKHAMWAQVRLSSEYLWSVRDLAKVVSDVQVFLEGLFDPYIKLVPSSLDMTVDVANLDWGTVQGIKESFISRAQLDSDHVASVGEPDGFVDGPDRINRRWRRLTGFSFGARAAAVSAVIYDKHHQVKYKEKEKEWFFDLWRQAVDENNEPVWDGESPVWRIEMRLRREALNELMCEGVFHGIESAFELEDVLPGLWAYLVGSPHGGADGLPDGWLRYVIPTGDTNRSRWPVHPDWQVIQSAFQGVPQEEFSPPLSEFGSALIAPADPICFDLRPFVRRRKRRVNTDRVVAQIAGCLVTLEAWREVVVDQDAAVPDLSDTMHYAYELIEGYLERKAADFAGLAEDKRLLYLEPCCTVCAISA
jgi:hypothetical protein